MKFSIRAKVMLLVFVSVAAVLVVIGVASYHEMKRTEDTIDEQEKIVGEYMTRTVGQRAESSSKERLAAVAMGKAKTVDRELANIAEDVSYISQVMEDILANPQRYPPRRIQRLRDNPDAVGNEVWLYKNPGLAARGTSPEVQREIELCGNIEPTIRIMATFYTKTVASVYVSSVNDYSYLIDLVAPGEDNRYFPKPGDYQKFTSSFDTHERDWYGFNKTLDKPIYSDVYRTLDGTPCIACTKPYHYPDGSFAGIVAICYGVDDIFKYLNEISGKDDEPQLVIDKNGHVIYSSLKSDLLKVDYDNPTDIREDNSNGIAEAAKKMTAGENGVMTIEYGADGKGDDFYVAFAPIATTGWSYATYIPAETVTEKVQKITENVLDRINELNDAMRQAFVDSAKKSVLVTLPVIALLLAASYFMALRLTGPIGKLAKGAREIAGGNFDKKLEINTGDELQELAADFNAMGDELKRYIGDLSEAVALRERDRAELEIAASIQADMLPNPDDAFPDQDKFEIFASMTPAKDVGGDFYDFYPLDENRVVFTIADVSGKGVPAALFMAKSRAVIGNCVLAAADPAKLAAAIENANAQLCRGNDAAMFVTVFVGILDLRDGTFTYVDGGHCPAIVGHDGHYDFLPADKGTMLGLMEMPYTRQEVKLVAGDTLFVYTDGVSEAMNEKREQFTEKRIVEELKSLPKESNIREILAAMSERVKQHAGAAEQSDDITMLGIKILK